MFRACKRYVKPVDLIVLGVVMALPMLMVNQPEAAGIIVSLLVDAG